MERMYYKGREIVRVLAETPDECDGCIFIHSDKFCLSNIEGYKRVDEVYTCCPKSGEEYVFKYKEEAE